MLVAGLLFGNYAGSANSGNWGMSIAQGMTARLAKAGGTRTSVPHLSHNRLCISTDSSRWHETVTAVPGLQGIGDAASADNFAAAIAAAKAADVTVVTLGALAAILAALSSLHGSCCDSDGGCGAITGLAFDSYCSHNSHCPENKTCDVCESEGHDRKTIELASGQVQLPTCRSVQHAETFN